MKISNNIPIIEHEDVINTFTKNLKKKRKEKGYTQRQAVLILYGVTATLGMIAIILLDSGIWKALSFALLVIAIVAIGYKDIVHLRDNEEIENEKLKSNRTDKNI